MTTNDIQQGSEEWHAMRKFHLGASDAPVVMGCSPWKTSYQLWEEKMGLRESTRNTAAMMRGIEMEPLALQAYNDSTGRKSEPTVLFHEEHKFMMASLDGFDGEVIVEIKCPGVKDHDLAAKGIIPDKYYPQLQHQLAVADKKLLHYFSYSPESYYLLEVERDEEYISNLYEKEKEFWHCVQNFAPPSFSDDDYRVRTDSEWIEASQNWKKSHDGIMKLKEDEKYWRERLIELAGVHSTEGAGVRLKKVKKAGVIDYKAIPEIQDQDINLEKYRKAPIEYWKITNQE